MGFSRKQPPPEEEPGAPEWMLTFSDCMTLLLTFFVLLITFSAPGSGPDILQTSAVFRRIMPGLGRSDERYRNALLNIRGAEPTTSIQSGSETSTSETTGWGNLAQGFSMRYFGNRRVFLIPSEKVFWGRGTFVSLQGRGILQTMTDLLRRLPDRVIISEGRLRMSNIEQGISKFKIRHSIFDVHSGPAEDGQETHSLGLQRSWAVLDYLAAEQHLGTDRFSLSAIGTVHREHAQAGFQDENGAAGQRMVEIVLLERSLYN